MAIALYNLGCAQQHLHMKTSAAADDEELDPGAEAGAPVAAADEDDAAVITNDAALHSFRAALLIARGAFGLRHEVTERLATAHRVARGGGGDM